MVGGVLTTVQTFVAVQVDEMLLTVAMARMMSMPGVALPVYVNAVWPLPSVVIEPLVLTLGPAVTRKFTAAPAAGMPSRSTVAVTVCAVLTVFVAELGASMHPTTGTQGVLGNRAENSLVLLFGSVAVAVKNGPTGVTPVNVTEKLFVPLAAVVTLAAPRNCWPWPKPLSVHKALAKNSSRKAVFGVLGKNPAIVTLPPFVRTLVMTGKFWRWFGPSSASPASLLSGPLTPRSIPRSLLAKMEFAEI